VYLTWAIAVFLAFFPFSRINNFWRLNVVAGSIPTRASTKSPIKMRLFEGYCKSFPLEGFLPRFDPRAAVLLPNLNALVPDQTADAFKETARSSRSRANVSRNRCGARNPGGFE